MINTIIAIFSLIISISALFHTWHRDIKERDPELTFYLTQRSDNNGDPDGYKLGVINNSRDNSVLLRNMEFFGNTFNEDCFNLPYVKNCNFRSDTVLPPHSSTILCEFTRGLRNYIKQINEFSWKIHDITTVNNPLEYQVTLKTLGPKRNHHLEVEQQITTSKLKILAFHWLNWGI